jgi:lycopene beta-cyclase
MARGRRDGLLIAGGGLAGCLAALALARHRPDVPLLIVEEDTKFGGDGLWWALADELGEEERALIEPLVEYRWPGYYLAFPGANRKIRSDILAFSAAQLQIAVATALKTDQYRLGTRAVAVREDALVLDGGETIKADGAIDARGATNLSVLRFLYRTALVRDLSFKTPHRLDRPVLIDAAVDGGGAFRYAECLPIDETRMMIAGTTIGEAPHIDASAMREWIDDYVAARGWVPKRGGKGWEAIHPMPVEGDFGAFWRIGGARVAKIGMRGGFMHHATGLTPGDGARRRCA